MKSSFKLFMGGLAVASGLTFLNSSPAQATCSTTPYMSTVCWTMSYYCPDGYAEANGQLLSINQYQALYSLLGTAYGGDGRTNFALPDLRGRVNIGTGQGPGQTNVYLGQRVGQEEHTITVDNMPSHSHSVVINDIIIDGHVTAVSDTGTEESPTDAFPAARPSSGGTGKERKTYYSEDIGGTPVAMASDSVDLTISPNAIATEPALGKPVGNQEILPLRAPQVGVLACVAVRGIYPPRS